MKNPTHKSSLLGYFGYDLKLIKGKEVRTDNKDRLSQDGNPKRR